MCTIIASQSQPSSSRISSANVRTAKARQTRSGGHSTAANGEVQCKACYDRIRHKKGLTNPKYRGRRCENPGCDSSEDRKQGVGCGDNGEVLCSRCYHKGYNAKKRSQGRLQGQGHSGGEAEGNEGEEEEEIGGEDEGEGQDDDGGEIEEAEGGEGEGEGEDEEEEWAGFSDGEDIENAAVVEQPSMKTSTTKQRPAEGAGAKDGGEGGDASSQESAGSDSEPQK